MELHISLEGAPDLVAAVYRQLADAITEGAFAPGDRLPSTRALAADLGVARGTVQAAYDRLLGEGLTEGRVGAGTFVADLRRPASRSLRGKAGALRPAPLVAALVADPSVARDGRPPPDTGWRFDFRLGRPDPALFPRDEWRRAVADALRPGARLAGEYAPPVGLPVLRAAVARHIRLSRAVRADPDDVVITNGAQHGMSLLARALLSPGDTVAVEDPGYPPIRALFGAVGARLVPVPTDAEGIRVDRLPDRARVVYTTPSHQFPLGVPQSAARRRELLEWAAERDAAVIEDDYDSEFRYGGRPLDALHSLDRHGRVVYVGTFSKSLDPSLRLGFLVVPNGIRPAVELLRRATDQGQDPVPQAALARLIDDGVFAGALRRARRVYERRHAALVESLAVVGGALTAVPSHAGLHLAARLDPAHPRSARRIAADARADGLALEPLEEYHLTTPAASGLVLGFGLIPEERIRPGVETLARHL